MPGLLRGTSAPLFSFCSLFSFATLPLSFSHTSTNHLFINTHRSYLIRSSTPDCLHSSPLSFSILIIFPWQHVLFGNTKPLFLTPRRHRCLYVCLCDYASPSKRVLGMPPRQVSESNFGVAAEAPGVGKILEKDLIEPGQIMHGLRVPSTPFLRGL